MTLIQTEKEDFNGLCFANINDFDSKYGHRRDVKGYGKALEQLDQYLPEIINHLKFDDLLIIVADHGNDPTYKGTDHTRETIPVLIYSKKLKESGKIDDLSSFSDLGSTIAENFHVVSPNGQSFLKKIK